MSEFKVEQLDHVEMLVDDLEAAVDWYRRVLGLREVGRFDPHPVMIGAGGTLLALFSRLLTDGAEKGRAQPPIPQPAPGYFRRVAFRTDADGFEAAQRHLVSQGIAFQGPVDHQVSWSIYFYDADGHPLEITTYREPDYPLGGGA